MDAVSGASIDAVDRLLFRYRRPAAPNALEQHLPGVDSNYPRDECHHHSFSFFFLSFWAVSKPFQGCGSGDSSKQSAPLVRPTGIDACGTIVD